MDRRYSQHEIQRCRDDDRSHRIGSDTALLAFRGSTNDEVGISRQKVFDESVVV